MRQRLGRTIGALAWIVAGTAVVAGVPIALSRLVGSPLPADLPEWREIRDVLGGASPSDATLVKALAVVVWGGWLLVVVSLVAEIRATARGVATRRRRGLGLAQGFAYKVVASALMLLPGGLREGAVQIAPVAVAASTGVLAPAWSATIASAPNGIASLHAAAADYGEVAVDPIPPGWEEYTVQAGDGNVEYILERRTPGANVRRVWEIVKAMEPYNLGRAQPSHEGVLSDLNRLRVGWTIVVPLAVSAVPGAPIPEPPTATRVPPLVDLPDEIEVQPGGDNFWAISERLLEHAYGRAPTDHEVRPYWLRLIEANRDVLTDPSDPDLLFAGQRVRVVSLQPPGAGEMGAQEPAAPAVSDDRAEPQQVDNTVPAGPISASGTAEQPCSVHAGAEPASPGADSGLPSSTVGDPSAAPAKPARVPPQDPASESSQPEAIEDDTDESPAGRTLRPGLLGATALATWALVLARRRRNRRLRRRRAGQVFPPVDPTLEPMALAVRGNADLDGLDRLDAALRHLAVCAGADDGKRPWRSGVRRPTGNGVKGTDAPVPQAVLRHPNDNRIEVFLARPVATPSTPWEVRADGAIWALAPDAPLPDHGSGLVPCPALVQLGTTDDGAELYVDLEALGTLGLDGTPEAVRQIARALTATLVVSPAAAYCRVLTYGFDPLGLDMQDRLRLVVGTSVDAVLSEAESTAGPVAKAVDAEAAGSSFRLRGRVSEEGWEPAVVIVADGALSPEEDERLTSLGAAGSRGAAVVKAGTAPRWTLTADEPRGWWRLNPLGLRVRPVGIAAEELEELVEFLAEADAAPVDVAVVEPAAPSPNGHVGHVQPDPAPAAPVFREPEWRAMVRVLGPVDIVDRSGVPHPVDRNQPLELVAWLATNRGYATRTRAIDALWSGRAIDPRSIRNVITSARILLRNVAGDPPNEQWIPHRRQELELDPLVVTDIDLLRARIAYAKQLGADERAAALAEGLELVRGIPFEGSPWLWADDLVSDMSVDVVDMILDLARLRLQAGDMRGAVEAAGVGLRVIPLHEQLTELSMQAWTASGERRRALDVYEAYERAVAARGEEVAPEIARLRNELLRAVSPD